jgi:opacity protein-like surface antigen
MQAAVLSRIPLLSIFLIFLITQCSAQDHPRFNISAGAGVSIPTSDASGNLNTGWNFVVRGGVNVSRDFLADLDFSYNHFSLTNAALANFGQPGGYGDVWSLTFAPEIRIAPGKLIDPYVIAGAGLYHRSLSLTQPANEQTIFCDPFFGYCYPATVATNVVVASFSTFKPGFNLGGGLDFRLGGHLKAFTEARYNEMFTTHGPNLTYVPVTFGLRW